MSRGRKLARRSLVELARHLIGREVVKSIVCKLVNWPSLPTPEAGYTILVGVPWDLRHLLPVNLRFIAEARRSALRQVLVVFDRTSRSEAASLVHQIRSRHPELPLRFLFYPRAPGRIIERVKVSTFFNSMNIVTGLAACRTRWLLLHDFDLFPIRADYFERIYETLELGNLRFAGVEQTYFDGLLESDRLFGTWGLGMDASWLRNERSPREIFHRMVHLRGRWMTLDPLSWLQTQTDRRTHVEGVGPESFCHVRNLCSSYLRMRGGRSFKAAWRLHYLWYLEALAGLEDRLHEATHAMQAATGRSSMLRVGECAVDFAGTHPSCADVLRADLERMETYLHGRVRPAVELYLRTFADFLRQDVVGG